MASDVKVLIVDDNPVILDMLQKALEPHALVATVRGASEAIDHVALHAPDLIIADYHMPQMDGRALIQELRRTASRVPAILMASRADQNEKLGMLRDSVEDFVDKPFFLRDAVTRIKRVIDKIALEKMAEAPGDGIVRGTLAQMNTIDLLQSLELGRKTCRLNISRGPFSCDMFFNDGQLADAVAGDLVGDEAVYKTLLLTEGTWEIDFTSSSPRQTTTRSTQGLLMEGLRLLDEANRDAEDNVLDG